MGKANQIQKGSLRDLTLEALKKLGGCGSIQQIVSEVAPFITASKAMSTAHRIKRLEAQRRRPHQSKGDLCLLIVRGKKHLVTQALAGLCSKGHVERVRLGVYRTPQNDPEKVLVLNDHIREYLKLHGESSTDLIVEDLKNLVTEDKAIRAFSSYKKCESRKGKRVHIQDKIGYGTKKIIRDQLSSLVHRKIVKRTRKATRTTPAWFKLAY